jgi:hypothetical protein
MNADVKAMILGALDDAGGQEYLAKQANENPTAFMTLLGKILPLQVTGKDGGPVEHRIDTPAKESREEWLARQMEAAARPAVGSDPGDMVH